MVDGDIKKIFIEKKKKTNKKKCLGRKKKGKKLLK